MAAFDPSRLYSSLLNTGLQTKDNPLYQVIHDLIGTVVAVNTQANTLTSGGSQGPQGLQGLQGIAGLDGDVIDSDVIIPRSIQDLVSSFTQGSVLFAGPSGSITQDNSKFFWDDTNFRLGLGTAVPLLPLDIQSSVVGNLVNGSYNTDFTAGSRNFWRSRQAATGASSTSAYFGQGQDQKLYIINNDLSKNMLVLDTAGNLGIGTNTPASSSRLGFHLFAPSGLNAICRVESTVSSGNGAQFEFLSKTGGGVTTNWLLGTGLVDTLNSFTIYDTTDSKTVFQALTSGNVGIGTATPGFPVEINPVNIAGGSVGTGMLALVGQHNTVLRPYILFKNKIPGTTFTGGIRWVDGNNNEGWAIENNRVQGSNIIEFNLVGSNKASFLQNQFIFGTSSITNGLVVIGQPTANECLNLQNTNNNGACILSFWDTAGIEQAFIGLEPTTGGMRIATFTNARPMNFYINNVKKFFLDTSGNTNLVGFIPTFNNISTAGLGVPAVYGIDNRTGLTGADGAATTLYTTIAANNIFRVSADIFATAAVTGTATYTIKWTENATSQSMAVTATAINTLGTQSNIIRPDNATTITAQLTGVFTGTFTVVGLVEQIA